MEVIPYTVSPQLLFSLFFAVLCWIVVQMKRVVFVSLLRVLLPVLFVVLLRQPMRGVVC